VLHKKGLISSIAISRWCQTNTVDDAPSVSIDNKNGLVGSIQDYGISRLLPDAVDGKELLAEVLNFMGKELVKVVIIALSEPVGEGLKLQGFGIIVATGINKASQLRER
jgi:hypothetical protein